jgi:hypothetical protein
VHISQKAKLEAIRYALSRRDGLTRFVDDGRIEIDSNIVERAIRPIAFNRKNLSSPARTAGQRTGRSSPRSSSPASSIASLRKPIWPTSS